MYTYSNGTAALQFPSSYVLMEAEEMEYVDGGYTFLCDKETSSGPIKASTWIIGAAIDVGLQAMGVWNVSAVGYLMGAGLSKLCSGITKKISSKIVGAVLKSKVLQTSLGSYITSKIGVLGTALGCTSLGGMIATAWDAWDGSLDSYVLL